MFFETNILILIVSSASYYEEVLNSLTFLQNIEITMTNVPTQRQLAKASIIIYDETFKERDNSNTYAMHICILNQKQYNSSFDLSKYDDVWFLPMDINLLKYRFTKLVEQAINKKRSEINEIYLNTLINSVPDLIWFKDLRGAHLKVNDAFGIAVGKTPQQCEGRGHYYIWDLEPDEYSNGEYVCLETEEEVIKRGVTCLFDEKVKAKNGLRQFKTYKSPLYSYQGEMLGTVGIAKDVTDLHNVSRELEIVLSSVPFASLIVDEQDHLVYGNQVFYTIFNIDSLDKDIFNYHDFCQNKLHLTEEEMNRDDEIIIPFIDNKTKKYLSVQQQSIQDIFGNHFGYFLICVDVTSERELQNKILSHANTDFLTGLYNRRYFYKIVHTINPTSKTAFVYLDLDYFKTVNDTFGHQVGDEALRVMSTLLQDKFPDDLIVRLGGDEFLIAIAIKNDINEIIPKVKDFVDYTKNAFQEKKQYDVLSISVGISYGKSDFDTDQLLLEADKALYKAKSLGRGIVYVYDETCE